MNNAIGSIPSGAGRNNKLTLSIVIALLAAIYIVLNGQWPEIYGFATNPELSRLSKFLVAPVHLNDDVMISFRSGYMLRDIGLPAFNRSDLAQASTSYASPYLFAFLISIFRENIAVSVYALLGMISVALTLGLIVRYSRSTINGILLALGLSLTNTNILYSLNGWDHLFQGFFVTLAACIALRTRATHARLLIISGSLVLGSLFRPDSIIISLAILFSCLPQKGKRKAFALYGALPFAGSIVAFLSLNYIQFGHLTPTTARLKLGASPSLEYAVKYVLENSLLSYTALTLLILLFVFYARFFRILDKRRTLPIAIGCFVTAVIAAFNSDVIPGGRMFWTSACIMCSIIACKAPPLLECMRWPTATVNEIYLPKSMRLISAVKALRPKFVLVAILLMLSAYTLPNLIADRINYATVSVTRIDNSIGAFHYIIARWIEKNLDPADGALGFFHLGTSYHLPRFEIADFLGKADEIIAQTPVRWGPPGHNKWDIDRTIDKWNPQAIIAPFPPNEGDPSRDLAISKFNSKSDDSWLWEIAFSKKVAEGYTYCYAPDVFRRTERTWGFYLRNDIAARQVSRLRCVR